MYGLDWLNQLLGRSEPTANQIAQLGQPRPTISTPVVSPAVASSAAVSTPATAAATDPADMSWGQKLGVVNLDKTWNLSGIADIAQGIGSIGSIYAAMQGLGLAKDQFAFQKEAYKTNLNNSRMAYNTALEDRTANRLSFQGRDPSEGADYIAKHKI